MRGWRGVPRVQWHPGMVNAPADDGEVTSLPKSAEEGWVSRWEAGSLGGCPPALLAVTSSNRALPHEARGYLGSLFPRFATSNTTSEIRCSQSVEVQGDH